MVRAGWGQSPGVGTESRSDRLVPWAHWQVAGVRSRSWENTQPLDWTPAPEQAFASEAGVILISVTLLCIKKRYVQLWPTTMLQHWCTSQGEAAGTHGGLRIQAWVEGNPITRRYVGTWELTSRQVEWTQGFLHVLGPGRGEDREENPRSAHCSGMMLD